MISKEERERLAEESAPKDTNFRAQYSNVKAEWKDGFLAGFAACERLMSERAGKAFSEDEANKESARYQTSDPSFCGVDMSKHDGFMFGARWQHAQIHARIEGLVTALKYFKDAQCECSIEERLSGHLSGCWKPEADEKIDHALKNFGGEG